MTNTIALAAQLIALASLVGTVIITRFQFIAARDAKLLEYHVDLFAKTKQTWLNELRTKVSLILELSDPDNLKLTANLLESIPKLTIAIHEIALHLDSRDPDQSKLETAIYLLGKTVNPEYGSGEKKDIFEKQSDVITKAKIVLKKETKALESGFQLK